MFTTNKAPDYVSNVSSLNPKMLSVPETGVFRSQPIGLQDSLQLTRGFPRSSASASISDNSPAGAINLGSLSSTISRSGFVGSSDTQDYFRFSLSSTRNVNLSLTGLAADANLYLYRAVGDSLSLVTGGSSARSGNADEAINLANVGAGDYYIRVSQYSGDTHYTLRLSTHDPSNLLPIETNVGILNGTRNFSDSVGSTDTSDIYSFSLSSIRNVTLALTGMSSDADLRLARDYNLNGIIDPGEIIASSTHSNSWNEALNRNLEAGNYFVQVYQYSGNTNYQLRMSAFDPLVSVDIRQVIGLNNPDSGLFGDNADYFARVTINGVTQDSGVISNSNSITPNWHFSRAVNSRYVPVRIELWDRDGGLFDGGDDSIDINPNAGSRILNFTYDIVSNTITGDVGGDPVELLSRSGGQWLSTVGGHGDRARMSFKVGTGDWYARNLLDAGVEDLTRSFAADGQLNRDDMINILRNTKDGSTIDSTEVTDLRTVLDGLGYMMPEHVRVLSNKVINSDPANTRSGIGNLFAGSSATQMENLIGKWFLGNVRPSAPGTTYQFVNGSLFQNGISYLDIDQNAVADCYFLSSLGAVAFRSPSIISSMFIDNGDDTFTVRMYNNGVADYVTVDRWLPTNASSTATAGGAVFAGWGGGLSNNPNNELWVALAEKAYAQFNESGWIGQDNTNTYAGIAFGWHDVAMRHITGLNATNNAMNNSSVARMISNFNARRPISLCTNVSTSDGIVGNHCYTLIGYNAVTDQFRVYNPQNYNNDAQAERWITRAQLLANFSGWAST